jgi:hypothetical protein
LGGLGKGKQRSTRRRKKYGDVIDELQRAGMVMAPGKGSQERAVVPAATVARTKVAHAEDSEDKGRW